ncbi:LANO_0H21550g1_1 [Lachancea nothofagi CBS 11611]|uniref:Crossover junction endonuclease MUS81 n=1 Tax=Lachancea nothofagi CBS 11611 TaxID=1266666 RepID=A0A1G4KNE4_9SACH|nr:LANO_0H21550g1_1 [Lachancea nothofagi CBS 11611]
MSLPSNLKPLYIEWLETETEKAVQKSEKLGIVYAKALENLRVHDNILRHPNELLAVKGIGNSIKNVLKDRLHAYCKDTGFELPYDPALQVQNIENRQRTKIRSLDDQAENDDRPKKKRRYVPKRRSGAYAILLGLLESNRSGSSKNEVVSLAHKYCDHSFNPNPSSRDFHSAWSAMKTLLAREFVLEEGRPKRYILTKEGEEMAHTLKKADEVTFEDEGAYQDRRNTQSNDGPTNDANDSLEVSANYSDLMEPGSSRQFKVISQSVLDDINPTAAPQIAKKSRSIPGGATSNLLHTDTPAVGRSLRGIKDNIIRARWNGVSYELWEPGAYEIVLAIDHREVKSKKDREFFANQLQEKGITVDTRQLSLSDMIWLARNKTTKRECVLNFMLERKRLDDFAMSIMDNRFVEQKNRLKKTGCKNIYYLVEDIVSDTAVRMADAIRTAVWVTMIYNDFHVKRTKNSDDTVTWLKNMTEVIESHYLKKSLLVMSPHDLKNQEDYFASLQNFRQQFERNETLECCQRFDCFQEIMNKKSLMSVKELYLRALMVNKGVSLEKAVSIQAKFPTLKMLLAAYRNCDSDESGKALISSTLKDEPGTRKVGKALSETLWKTFGKR